MAPEEEFLALRDIFFADLGEDDVLPPPVEEQPIYDANDEEEEDDEEDHSASFAEADFKFQDFAGRLAHPKVVRACGLALRDFQTNSPSTNNCIVKLLHRIAFDCKMYVMIFQVSIFRTFQKIYANKDFPQYRELVRFATYIIRQFIKLAEVNKKVYMESLFFKQSAEAYEIEHGYGTNHQKAASRAWSEEQEDELRRLFMEHQQNQSDQDVVDWIVDNLIDNTRTRRGVLKKLKEMSLIVGYKGQRKSTTRTPRHWGAEEEMQLRELYEEFRDAADPVGCIIARLEVARSKPAVVQKLLDLGMIRDRAEVRKKRGRGASTAARNSTAYSDDDAESNGSDDDDDDLNEAENSSAPVQKKQRKQVVTKKRAAKTRRKQAEASDRQVAELLIKIVDLGMSEAADWLRESFVDALEDFESDDNCEGIPLVPIMDYAVDAMENADFQETLKALGIVQPFDEQESYWRIPGDLSVDTLRKYADMLQQAIDRTLTLPENSNSQPILTEVDDILLNENLQNSDNENDDYNENTAQRTTKRIRTVIDSSDESDSSSEDRNTKENTINDQSATNETVNKSNLRRIVDSDDEDRREEPMRNDAESDKENETINWTDKKNKNARRIVDDETDEDDEKLDKRQAESHSESEEPAPKRTRIISSDED